jgi:hypothetical protein
MQGAAEVSLAMPRAEQVNTAVGRAARAGSLVLSAVMASTALAQAAPVGIWVDVHYADWPDQPARTKTFQFQLDGMDKVTTLCDSETNLMRLVAHIQRRDTFLQHESIFDAVCVSDRSGNIKTAARVSPAGSN